MPTVATKAPIDYLRQARDARALVDEIGERHAADPLAYHGRNVGEMQRLYLLAAAVDALIDIAATLRGDSPPPEIEGDEESWSVQ